MTGSLDCRHHVSILLPQAQLPPSGCGGSCACGYLLPFALCWTGWCVSHDSLTKVAWSAHSWCVRTWSTQSRLRSGVVTERHKSVVGVTQVTCRVAPPPSEIWRNLLLGMCAWNDVSPCAPRRFCCFIGPPGQRGPGLQHHEGGAQSAGAAAPISRHNVYRVRHTSSDSSADIWQVSTIMSWYIDRDRVMRACRRHATARRFRIQVRGFSPVRSLFSLIVQLYALAFTVHITAVYRTTQPGS